MLNEIHGVLQTRDIYHWRDKRGDEIDFVRVRRRGAPVAIECKWSADAFEPTNLHSFRRQYPGGDNFVVAQDVGRAYTRRFRETTVRFVSLRGLMERLGP